LSSLHSRPCSGHGTLTGTESLQKSHFLRKREFLPAASSLSSVGRWLELRLPMDWAASSPGCLRMILVVPVIGSPTGCELGAAGTLREWCVLPPRSDVLELAVAVRTV